MKKIIIIALFSTSLFAGDARPKVIPETALYRWIQRGYDTKEKLVDVLSPQFDATDIPDQIDVILQKFEGKYIETKNSVITIKKSELSK